MINTNRRRQAPWPITVGVALAALLSVAAAAGPARAGETTSAKGYTLSYPDGWELASAETQAQLGAEARRLFEGMGNLDLSLIPQSTGRRWLRARRPELYGPLTVPTGIEQDTRTVRFARAKTE